MRKRLLGFGAVTALVSFVSAVVRRSRRSVRSSADAVPADGFYCVWCRTPADGNSWVTTRHLGLQVPVCFDVACIRNARKRDFSIANAAQESGNHREGSRAREMSKA